MSNFFDTLDEIENRFISNSHDVSMIACMSMKLDILIKNDNNDINLGLLNALKKIIKTVT